MRHLRRAAYGAVLLTVLALCGCSGGAEPRSGPESPTTSETSAETSPTPTEPPPPTPVDPCTLLTAEDLEAAGVTAVVDESVRSLVPDPRTSTCLAPHPKEGWGIYYGFSTRPRVEVSQAIDQVGTEQPRQLVVGDEALLVLYDAYDDRVWHAWAREGRYTVMLQLFEKPKPADVEALLATLLDGADPDMFEFPIDLPRTCPSPKQKAITNLIGTVATATGSQLPNDLRCDYASARGLTLNLSGSPVESAQKARSSIGNVEEYFDEKLTPAPGVTLLLSPGDGYAFTSAYALKPPSYYSTGLQSQTVIGNVSRPLTYDEEAFRAMAVWWSKQRL
ncbi:MAG: hypothetical protein WKF50_02245 [Nocardioides sp.]